MGVDIPPIDLVCMDDLEIPEVFRPTFGESSAYVIDRFDRAPGGQRIHIEDFNQVRDRWPGDKYRGDSAASLGELVVLVTDHDERSLEQYLRRLVAIVILGNEDAHPKNWSLIYRHPQRPVLAPAYDLVATVAYTSLQRGLAFNLGRTRDPQAVEVEDLVAVATRMSMDSSVARSTVDDAIERARATRDDAVASFGSHGPALTAHLDALRLWR